MILNKKDIPILDSKVRILHSLVDSPSVDVYANDISIAKNISFSEVSNYIELEPDVYDFKVYKSSFKDKPLLDQKITISQHSSYTICIVSFGIDIYFYQLLDSYESFDFKSSHLRFINLSPNSPLITLYLDNNKPIFDYVEYLETTNYNKFSPGIYNFKVLLGSSEKIYKTISNIKLENTKMYTIYILGLFKGKPKLGYIITDDKKA